MNEQGYPAKPQVKPQTGRVPQNDKGPDAFKGTSTSELREALEVVTGPSIKLFVDHVNKMIDGIKDGLAGNQLYVDRPELVAVRQGNVSGLREFHNFFESIAIEYKRRIAKEEALNQGAAD